MSSDVADLDSDLQNDSSFFTQGKIAIGKVRQMDLHSRPILKRNRIFNNISHYFSAGE